MNGPAPQGGLHPDPAVYDILQAPGTAAEVDALERVESRFSARAGRADRLWYEPACGTGRYLRVAARRGRRVAGYDRDPRMVAFAARSLGPAVRAASLTDPVVPGVRPGSVDLAFTPVNTIRLLSSDADLQAHLAQVAWLLAPGGIYVVGISLTDYERAEPEEDLWEGVRGRCRVSQLVNYLPPEPGTPRGRIETVISHLMITRPRGVEHADDRYDLRCYSRLQWRRQLARSPLAPVASCDEGGRPFRRGLPPYQLEVLAVR